MKKLLCSMAMFALLVAPTVTLAQINVTGPLNEVAGNNGIGYDTSQTSLTETIGQIIQVALGFLGVVALLLFLYAGFLWMTAGGNEDQVTKARKWMTNAIIGMIIIFAAYALTSFVVTSIVDATGQG